MDFGSIIGGAAGNIFGTVLQDAFSARQAAIQRDFQDRMAGQMYQYRARDMAAAGLNPILAATQGAGSAPGGASASSGSFGDVVSSARTAAMMDSEVKRAHYDAEASKFRAGQENTLDMRLGKQLAADEQASVFRLQSSAKAAAAESDRVDAELERRVNETSGEYARRLTDRYSGTVKGVRDVVNPFSARSVGGRGAGLRYDPGAARMLQGYDAGVVR